MRRTKLPGHALRREGQPYTRGDGGWVRSWSSWTGVGLCECGATSEVLKSNNARKAWHREHKDAIRSADGS